MDTERKDAPSPAPLIDVIVPVPSDPIIARDSIASMSAAAGDWEEGLPLEMGTNAKPMVLENSSSSGVRPVVEEENAAVAEEKISSFLSKISIAVWLGEELVGNDSASAAPGLGLSVLVRKRGGWVRTVGFGSQCREYLYPEEALHLLEEGKLLLYRHPRRTPDSTTPPAGGDADWDPTVPLFTAATFRAEVVPRHLPLPCWLAYDKLKRLDYIVQRHGGHAAAHGGLDDLPVESEVGPPPLKVLTEADVEAATATEARVCEVTLLIAYDAYINSAGWTKRGAKDGSCTPSAHVVVTTALCVPPSMLLRRLLAEGMDSYSWSQTARIPLYMLVVSPTSHYIALQEIGLAAPNAPANNGHDKAVGYLDLDNRERSKRQRSENYPAYA